MSRTIVIDSHGVPSRGRFTMDENSAVDLVYDFSLIFPDSGTLTASVTAEDSNLSVGTVSVSNKEATVPISASGTGTHYLEVKGSLGGESWQVVTAVHVTDYTAPVGYDDYDYGFYR